MFTLRPLRAALTAALTTLAGTAFAASPPSNITFDQDHCGSGAWMTISGSNLFVAGNTTVKFPMNGGGTQTVTIVTASGFAPTASQLTVLVPGNFQPGFITVTTPAGTGQSAAKFNPAQTSRLNISESQSGGAGKPITLTLSLPSGGAVPTGVFLLNITGGNGAAPMSVASLAFNPAITNTDTLTVNPGIYTVCVVGPGGTSTNGSSFNVH